MLVPVAVLASAPLWQMVLGGDIMLNGIPPSTSPLSQVSKLFRQAEYAYANLEIPLTYATTRTPRKTAADLRARNQFILKADTGHIAGIAECGFDALSLGNNHAMDFGWQGLKQMMALLDRHGISHSGAGENAKAAGAPAITTVGNVRVALLSFLAFQSVGGRWKCTPATDNAPGVATITLDRSAIEKEMQNAQAKADLVLVALHWGLEKQTVPTAYQVSLGRAFIDAGADAVIGAHPHVLQGAEMYRNKPILYSLGNLVSPRPGETGIVRLTYSHTSLKKMEFLPAAIRGGVVRLTAKGTDFAALCRAVAKKYPHPQSRIPNLSR